MTVNAGVWIDHRKAVVVLLSDNGEEIKRLKSIIPHRARAAGPRSTNSYTPNDFVAEDRLERKFASYLNEFYDEVIDCTHDAEAILIMGPGKAKGELRKWIESKKSRRTVAELETVDKMTDRQVAAKVRRYFSSSRETFQEKRRSRARSQRSG